MSTDYTVCSNSMLGNLPEP